MSVIDAEFGRSNGDNKGFIPRRVGFDRIPLEAPSDVYLRPHEVDRSTQVVWRSGAKTFNLGDPEDSQAYQDLLARVHNEPIKLLRHLEQWYTPENKPPVMYVFVAWVEPYRTLTKAAEARLSGPTVSQPIPQTPGTLRLPGDVTSSGKP